MTPTQRTTRAARTADAIPGDGPLTVTSENFEAVLLESAGQALEIARGERAPSRRYTLTTRDAIAAPAEVYTAERITGVRRRLKLSQPLFAAALNVSLPTVRGWEQGARTPEGSARRLLEIAERHPEILLETVAER